MSFRTRNELYDTFHREIKKQLEEIYLRQKDNIFAAAELIRTALKNGGRFYITGTGHSHMLAEESYTRAGGLAVVTPILPPEFMLHEHPLKSTIIERQTSYADVFFSLYDISKGDVLVLASNSGINGLVVEIAKRSKANGAAVIAITSRELLSDRPSRHESGDKLGDVADIVLDNYNPEGDVCCRISDRGTMMGASSTITGAYIIQQLSMAIAAVYMENGEEPPVFISSNVEGGDANNESLFRHYIDK